MKTYKFTKYCSIIDPSEIFYALAGTDADNSPDIKNIDGESYIQVTKDWKTAAFFKLDNLRPIGTLERDF